MKAVLDQGVPANLPKNMKMKIKLLKRLTAAHVRTTMQALLRHTPGDTPLRHNPLSHTPETQH